MVYSLTWLPDVLEDAGLKVAEVPGWRTRGLGDVGAIKGIICHHTVGSPRGNMPSLDILVHGRRDLRGPLCQLGLGRDGTYYVVAAGLAQHAGRGAWKDTTTGNSSFIGIEAENTGIGKKEIEAAKMARPPKILIEDPWPDVQLDAYRRGVAAILKKIGASADMCCGHKEYALPLGRKPDPHTLDMDAFRRDVAAIMGGAGPRRDPIPPEDPTGRPTLRRGMKDELVKHIQRKLGVSSTGFFGPSTEAAVRQLQRAHNLVGDGIVGPKTWALIDTIN